MASINAFLWQSRSRRTAAAFAAAVLLLGLVGVFPPAGHADAATYVNYTVRPGDSLWKIATAHGTTVAALQSANGIWGSTIYAGQTLRVPSAGTAYTVRSGDSLWKIAQLFGTTPNAIRSANGLWSSVIYPGQRIVIPGGGRTAASTASRSSTGTFSSADVDLMARLVRAEAEAEPYEGQVAVAAVVLNRVQSSRFPNTVRNVIYQGHQFEPVSNGRIYIPARDVHVRAVRDAIAGWDPSRGALYFFNPAYTSNSYLWSLTIVARIGNHVFAR